MLRLKSTMASTRLLSQLRGIASAAPQAAAVSTVDAKEVSHFQKLAKNWWDKGGEMRLLHSMNNLRVPLVRDALINTGVANKENVDTPQPLLGVSILDVGCGGGILSEPLARLGGAVTGLDATADLVEVAKSHASTDPTLKSLTYLCSTVEDHVAENEAKYDAVIASEIVEHVTNKEDFLQACVKCLKPKGSIFVTTLNKTLPSYVGGIVLAEYVFGLLPKGTHQWDKFITPPHLQRILEDVGCRTRAIHGMGFNFVNQTWFWSGLKPINYALHAVKF